MPGVIGVGGVGWPFPLSQGRQTAWASWDRSAALVSCGLQQGTPQAKEWQRHRASSTATLPVVPLTGAGDGAWPGPCPLSLWAEGSGVRRPGWGLVQQGDREPNASQHGVWSSASAHVGLLMGRPCPSCRVGLCPSGRWCTPGGRRPGCRNVCGLGQELTMPEAWPTHSAVTSALALSILLHGQQGQCWVPQLLG